MKWSKNRRRRGHAYGRELSTTEYNSLSWREYRNLEDLQASLTINDF